MTNAPLCCRRHMKIKAANNYGVYFQCDKCGKFECEDIEDCEI